MVDLSAQIQSIVMKKNPSVPRIKSLLKALTFAHTPVPILMEYQKEYGKTYWAYLGGIKRVLISSDPKFIKQVLQTKNKSYTKSEIQTDLLAKYVGYGLLTSKGPYWLKQRRLIQPGFHKQKLNNLSSILLSVCKKELDQLKLLAKGKQKVDLYPVMLKMAFGMVANSLFSVKMKQDDLETIETSISDIQRFIIKQIRKPYLKPWYWITGQTRKHLQLAADLKRILLQVIKERKSSGQRHDDLLDMLIYAVYEGTNEGMTEEQILWEAIILFIAGHETTANALSWIFYLLAKNPEVVKNIQNEVNNVIGDKSPLAENLRDLPYLNQVINEGMRIYPPAWLTDRIALEDDEFQDFNIKKGTMVIPFFYGAHHDSSFWKNPEKFVPARFQEKRQEAYFPFGAGPRMCIGNNFAMMEMQIAIIELLRMFKIEPVKDHEVHIEALITLRPKNGVLLNLALKDL